MRFEDYEIFACLQPWWFAVEWVAPCQPFLLDKGVNIARLCFLYPIHAGILEGVIVGQTNDRWHVCAHEMCQCRKLLPHSHTQEIGHGSRYI